MRKYLLLVLLMSLQMVVHGQPIAAWDNYGLPHPTTAKSMHYWIDDESGGMTTIQDLNGKHLIDVSSLFEGPHVIHIQLIDNEGKASAPYSSLFLRLAEGTSTKAQTIRYWFDDVAEVQTCDASAGIQLLDVSALQDGPHTLHCQLVDAEGNVSYVASGFFLKMEAGAYSAASTLRYWFDDVAEVHTCDANASIQMLDVSELQDGPHTLHYQLMDVEGNVSYVASSLFLKMETGAYSAASTLRFWFDEATDAVILDANEGTYTLDVSALQSGQHVLYCQAVDVKGKASYIASGFFQKMTIIPAPTASIASGTTVMKGTTVTLSCETEGATIYYTLDGSSPYDEATRQVYSDPIVINETVTVKAVAIAMDMSESVVAEFSYIVDESDGIDDAMIDEKLDIYPLPMRDKLYIAAAGKNIKSVTFASMNGSVALAISEPMKQASLDVSSLASGCYIITIVTEDNAYCRKVLKTK